MKLIVDMMGSDLGSKITVEAVNAFLKEHPDVTIFAVGRKEELTSLDSRAIVVDARDVIAMDAGPLDVMRAKESSMLKSLNLYLSEEADGMVSAGGTGAYLSAATIKLKLIPGVERAALVSPFPTLKENHYVIILDIGANNENTVSQLVQFAKMGQIYAKSVLKIENPGVFLLSNGSESGKGSPLIIETHRTLKEQNFPNFKGNIEGRDALNGEADVIVADGFTGNVFLKTTEGIAKMIGKLLKDAFTERTSSKVGYLFTRKSIRNMKRKLDYKNTGGAMLLGINGVVVKAHGSSDGTAFKNAIEVAYKMARHNVIKEIKEKMDE